MKQLTDLIQQTFTNQDVLKKKNIKILPITGLKLNSCSQSVFLNAGNNELKRRKKNNPMHQQIHFAASQL